MRFLSLVGGALGLTMMTTSAIADGHIYSPNSAYNWSGLYFGVTGGGLLASVGGGSPGGPITESWSASGLLAGVYLGHNWQDGNRVYGVEADIYGTTARGTSSGAIAGGVTTALNFGGSVRGRIGHVMDNWLLYATGGFAWQNVGVSGGFVGSQIHPGLTFGLGFERAINSRSYWGVEALVSRFMFRDYNPRLQPDGLSLRIRYGIQLEDQAFVSDMRLKRDIALVRRLPNGIGLYSYRYLWSDTVYVGVMAQEVAKIIPAAVVRGADGYLRVYYGTLGLKFRTLDDWPATAG